jgi:hypothetical protein
MEEARYLNDLMQLEAKREQIRRAISQIDEEIANERKE